MNALITCEHVDFGYENQDAVIDLNLTIDPGDYLCIVGANGSGKSTLIKGLLGLLAPTAGTLAVAEELRRGGIGYLPQQTAAQRDFPAFIPGRRKTWRSRAWNGWALQSCRIAAIGNCPADSSSGC